MNNLDQKQPKKKPSIFKRVKNNTLYTLNLSKYDPVTGDKIAKENEPNPENVKRSRLAYMEAVSRSKSNKEAPTDNVETARDAGLGGSLGMLGAHVLMGKSSLQRKGLVGAAATIGSGLLSVSKQKSEYNKQQASRELLSGVKTDRSSDYKNYLDKKYQR